MQLNFCSAQSVHRSAEQLFLVIVREPAVSAASQGSGSDASAEHDPVSSVQCDSPELTASIKALVAEFGCVFPADVPAGLPPDRGIHHAIPLQPDGNPPRAKHYRLSRAEEEEMKQQVAELLRKGWIQPSCSPYGAPIIFVKKKDGGFRMCVDYRMLNKQTPRNSYPLPRVDDMLDALAGSTIFTCLDMQSAYHQIRLSQEDVPKTAFTTSQGLYEYLVLPFGLQNAPATFQALMNRVLGDLRYCCTIYMDDILIHSKNAEEHQRHLRLVLERLRDHQLYCKISKCKFTLGSVQYLGNVVSADGVRPDPAKVQLVQSWPAPRNVPQLRSFVGLASHFRKFMRDFASLSAPLTALFRKNAPWRWAQAEQVAFAAIKTALTTAPVLKLPDYDQEFTVVADASGVSIGAVLLQGDLPIAFDGRKLTDVEQKWSPTEQEMLAVVHHMHKWRPYLHERHFTVVTDHEPNVWFHSQSRLNPRQHRWYEALRSYDFTWQYRPGKLNVADPLSRHPAFSAVILCACICAAVTRSRAHASAEPAAAPHAPAVPTEGGIASEQLPGPPAPAGMASQQLPEPPAPASQQDASNSAPAEEASPLVAPSSPLPDSSESAIGKLLVPNSPFNADAQSLLQQIRESYAADPFFSQLDASVHGRLGLSQRDGLYMRAHQVVVPGNSDLRRRILR